MNKNTKKRALAVCLLSLLTVVATAIPAKPGIWKTLRLTDGTEVRAQLYGDEHVHYWITEDGQQLAMTAEGYAPMSEEMLLARSQARRQRSLEAGSRSIRRVNMGERTSYTGQKKGLVILVEFTDVQFLRSHNQQKFNSILNTPGYSEGNFRGSVADYFKAQSNGLFELTFDVVGPYKLAHDMKYYGENDDDDQDKRPQEMIAEACRAANAEVNYADYDWDGDGEVDEVFVLYAGKGEADSNESNAVWPHMWELRASNTFLKLDGKTINTYACSNEMTPSGTLEGIGTFCHEFSHCLGFPDFYDINYTGQFGMSSFDIMDTGCYNGNGFCPPNYTAHEKMMCGWQQPIVLDDSDVSVKGLKPVSDNGDTYIIYNDAYPNEYYMLENRQKSGWDAAYPANGLMITHTDFDYAVWANNLPNTIITQSEAREMGYSTSNDHQRMTIVHADNDDDSGSWTGSYHSRSTLTTDLYPYKKNDSLTAYSAPATTLYHTNKQGTRLLQGAILNIRQNLDGTIDFDYRAKGGSKPQEEPDNGILFYESFDQCNGTGGNDGQWSNRIATSILKTDNDGWDALYGRGANLCARFGSTATVGMATTPSFNIDGEATLTFLAAPWVSTSDGTELQLLISSTSGDAPSISPSGFNMKKGEWTACEATISGKGAVKVTFLPDLRFFLDEVKVVKKSTAAITPLPSPTTHHPSPIYSLDGRYQGTSKETLRPGLYISQGQKIIIK